MAQPGSEGRGLKIITGIDKKVIEIVLSWIKSRKNEIKTGKVKY